MGYRVILIKLGHKWSFHTVTRTDNISAVSKSYWFKVNAQRDAKALARKLKAKFIAYE